MLNLTRKVGENIVIHTNPPVTITINWISPTRCNIGIDTNKEILILRDELDREYRNQGSSPQATPT